jgi:hypothetical protein
VVEQEDSLLVARPPDPPAAVEVDGRPDRMASGRESSLARSAMNQVETARSIERHLPKLSAKRRARP